MTVPPLEKRGSAVVVRDLAYVLVAAWLVRGLFLWFAPVDVISADLLAWNRVADELARGNNPYHTTALLNWPPVWIQVIFALSRAGAALDLTLTRAIQGFLIGVESLSMAATYLCLRRFFPRVRARNIVLLGFSVNPIAVFQVCQHGNFDVLAGLWVLLSVGAMLSYQRAGDLCDWILGCCCVGLGAVTKTTPLLLVPLCLWRMPRSFKARLLGIFLIGFPLCFGVGLLYTLTPGDVAQKVLGYRSSSGWFGVTGLLALVPNGGPGWAQMYVARSHWLPIIVLVATAILVLRRATIEPAQFVWLAVLPFLAIVAFGPGYGPQYISWYLPLLLLCYAADDDAGRSTLGLKLLFAIALATYTVEYALFPSHGSFLLLGDNPSQRLLDWSATLSTKSGQTLTRLPILGSYLGLLGLALGRSRA